MGVRLYLFAKAAPIRQQRRPPPVAETGRSCWGSGQQDTSALHEVDAGCRNPDRWHCEAMTVGFLLIQLLPLQMQWPLYASFSIAASGVRYSLQHSSYMREYSLLGLWCIRLLRVWES